MDTKKFVVSSAVTYVGTGINVALATVFYIISLRLVGQESYGALQSSMFFLFLLFTGKGIGGSYVVIHTGGEARNLPTTIRPALRLTIVIGLLTNTIFVVLAPYIQDFLHMPSSMPFVIMGLACVPAMIAGTTDGILNVQQKFGALSFTTILTPLSNVIMACVLLRDGLGPNDPGWLVLGGQLLHCLNILFVDWSFLRKKIVEKGPFLPIKEILPMLVVSLFLGASSRLDVSWARHSLSADAAGGYALCASIASVLYLLSSGIARISSVSLRNGPSMRIIGLSYAIIIGISCILGGGFALVGEPLLSLLVGHSVAIQWNILLPLFIGAPCFTLIMLDFSCLNVLTKHVHVSISIALLAVQIIALYFFGSTATSIAVAYMTAMVSLMFVFTFLLYRTARVISHSPEQSATERHLAPNA